MQGQEVDDLEWKGGMDVTYTFGGPLRDNQYTYNSSKIKNTS
jgi:hypothetical protein